MNETRTVAEFLSGLKFEDLPEDVVATAKRAVLDTIGVGLLASRRSWSKLTLDLAAESSGVPECTIWGHSLKTTAQQASLVNSTAAHGIEMDDRVPTAQEHPGCVAVPVAIALAERSSASGRDVLTAVVAGYELGVRVGLATTVKFPGIHPSGHKSVWVAIGAAAKALELDVQQTMDAYGLAGSMAGGVSEFQNDPRGTMVKRLHCGMGAHNGVLAALLAQKGFTGPSTILEGPSGYCHVYSAENHPAQINELTDDLGTKFRILEQEIKPYAAWGGSHFAIDAVGEILAQGALSITDIDHVIVRGSSRLITGHDLAAPESIMSAQYSLPFLTALTLARGPMALSDPDEVWTDETLRDPEILQLSAVVKSVEDETFNVRARAERHYGGARVEVVMTDGSTRTGEVRHSKGTLGNPVTDAELQEKFRRLARRSVGDDVAESLIEVVQTLDSAPDTTTLTRLIGQQGAQ